MHSTNTTHHNPYFGVYTEDKRKQSDATKECKTVIPCSVNNSSHRCQTTGRASDFLITVCSNCLFVHQFPCTIQLNGSSLRHVKIFHYLIKCTRMLTVNYVCLFYHCVVKTFLSLLVLCVISDHLVVCLLYLSVNTNSCVSLPLFPSTGPRKCYISLPEECSIWMNESQQVGVAWFEIHFWVKWICIHHGCHVR